MGGREEEDEENNRFETCSTERTATIGLHLQWRGIAYSVSSVDIKKGRARATHQTLFVLTFAH